MAQDNITDNYPEKFAGYSSSARPVALPRSHTLVHLDPDNRRKTWGERVFDLTTYGGFALLGNEAASLVITKMAEDDYGNAIGIYAPFKEMFTKLKGRKFVPEYVWNGSLPKVLIALIGGMMMVPFIKELEDRKSGIVRELDRRHYGARVEHDPELIAKHEAMDAAPKQSWTSLCEGRLVTIFAAIGVDSTVGWKDAPSTRLLQNNPTYQKYASMDRIATQIAAKTMDIFNISEAKRPNASAWVQRASWLLVLSSTLTALFYASSKVFAAKREKKNGAAASRCRQHTPCP